MYRFKLAELGLRCMTALDSHIDEAISTLAGDQATSRPFDEKGYIEAFQTSGHNKARDVLECLSLEKHFSKKKPFFVSIGGGDGEELDFLLRNSEATDGILIEILERLAKIARDRVLPPGKSLSVVAKAAQEGIVEAMRAAVDAVKVGMADAIVVTGHAVLHELYDRGTGGSQFDVVGFFGSIFPTPDIPILFTYREPGAPEKWPDQVLVVADCSSESLLKIANAIIERQPKLAALSPRPAVLGDGIRVHKDLGMEVITKIFYLPELRHELEERVTAVKHPDLQATIWTAMGDQARIENRAGIRTSSAPTKSFAEKWEVLKVQVNGILATGGTQPLATPESQTRVIAWRIPKTTPITLNTTMSPDIAMAEEALLRENSTLLEALLLSQARAWVEGDNASAGAKLLQKIAEKATPTSLISLWSRYLLAIQKLFGGDDSDFALFERSNEVEPLGLAMLFKAERMEFSRKRGDRSSALKLANELAPQFRAHKPVSEIESYATGTTGLLLSNFFRAGGRYQEAANFIARSQAIFKPGVPSHATELAHCFYAKQVCAALTGRTSFSSPESETSQEFAYGLIQLSYSHAAWSINDIGRATKHAEQAAANFDQIKNRKYADRAKSLHSLLLIWEALEQGKVPPYARLAGKLSEGVVPLVAGTNDGFLQSWLPMLRPSLVLGLLQFAKKFSPSFTRTLEISLPTVLHQVEKNWVWKEGVMASSLAEANRMLRGELEIPDERQVPLIAD